MAGVILVGPWAAPEALAESSHDHASPPCVHYVTADYADGTTDDSVLVGNADSVFLGQVIAQVGTAGMPTSAPELDTGVILFAVTVLEQIKGALPAQVMVGQVAESSAQTGCLVLIDGDELLAPGEIVLFVVSQAPGNQRFLLIGNGPYGAIRAHSETERKALVARFEVATRFQKVPDPRSRNRMRQRGNRRHEGRNASRSPQPDPALPLACRHE